MYNSILLLTGIIGEDYTCQAVTSSFMGVHGELYPIHQLDDWYTLVTDIFVGLIDDE